MSFASVLTIGGCTIDRFGRTAGVSGRLRTSNIGVMRASFGGAARNVAENLARLGLPASLVTIVGDDLDGRGALAATGAAGVDTRRSRIEPGARTASYTAIVDGAGELIIGLADMAILEELTLARIAAALAERGGETLLFLDANLRPEVLAAVIASKRGPVAVSPVSVQKSERVRDDMAGIDFLFLNRFEAEALLGSSETLRGLAAKLAASEVPHGVVSGDAEGAVAWSRGDILPLAAPAARPVNVNGAGDALAAATLARLARGDDFFTAARIGMAAGAMTVEAEMAVRADLSMDKVMARHRQAERA
jgi:sugar/nucleoside kinase (ribokinase family)